MKPLFSRKTFNPENADDAATLNTLRSQGAHRNRHGIPSTALKWAMELCKSGVLIDCGCGDSGDAWIADNAGFTSSGVDLFHPQPDFRGLFNFVRADVAERIPLEDGTVEVIICQAMLDLIEPAARNDFLKEANRVMKSGGIFACYLQWLEPGWGFDLNEEIERAENVWTVQRKSNGYIGRKP